jgi:hypothetical protein
MRWCKALFLKWQVAAGPLNFRSGRDQFRFVQPRVAAMVLSELGTRINSALRNLGTKTVIDKDAVDGMLKEIGAWCAVLCGRHARRRFFSTLRRQAARTACGAGNCVSRVHAARG